MKKVNLVVIAFTYLITFVALTYLPPIIPAHYSEEGIDRMGSKWELLVIPVVMTLVFLIFILVEHFYKKKKEQWIISLKIVFLSLIVSVISLFSQIKGLYTTFHLLKYDSFDINISYAMTALFISILGLIIFCLDEDVELYLNLFNQNNSRLRSKKIEGGILFLLGIIFLILTIFVKNLNLQIAFLIGILMACLVIYVIEKRIRKS